jgi:hypothetical protein
LGDPLLLEKILVYVKNTASEKIDCSAIDDGFCRTVKILQQLSPPPSGTLIQNKVLSILPEV